MSTRSSAAHVEIDGLGIAYRVDGRESADALVLVNSLGTDLRMWDPQMEALVPHFRVIRYDCCSAIRIQLGPAYPSGDARAIRIRRRGRRGYD